MMANNFDSTFPELWSTAFLKNFDNTKTMAKKVNSRFEAKLANYGDTVHADRINDLSVGTYSTNGTITYQDFTSTQDSLVLNQSPYIAFRLDDLEKAKTNKDLPKKMIERANVAMGLHIDSHLLGLVTDFTHTVGSTGTPIVLGGAEILAAFRLAARLLDDANVQEEGRCAIIPPKAFEQLAGYADSKDTDNSLTYIKDKEPFHEIAGIKVYKSTNMTVTGGSYYTVPIFVEKQTIDHVLRLNPKKVETMRLESTFGQGFRMLAFYGSKVFEPNTGVKMYLAQAS